MVASKLGSKKVTTDVGEVGVGVDVRVGVGDGPAQLTIIVTNSAKTMTMKVFCPIIHLSLGDPPMWASMRVTFFRRLYHVVSHR